MSGNALQTESSPAWKKEINRRVAEHKIRKGSSGETEPAQPEAMPTGNRRAAEAAARVAARYANAPSYSEALANEARAMVRAAEAAARAAQEVQLAAQSMLAGMGAIAEPEPQSNSKAFEVRWEPDLPVPPTQPPAGQAWRQTEAARADRRGPRADESQIFPFIDERGEEETGVVEPAQPIHANLIEFPRELVAARKARPRLAEAPFGAADVGTQLSIFEVEPSSVSTIPAAAERVTADRQTAPPLDQKAAPWSEPRWPEIELEPHQDHDAEENAIHASPAPEAQSEPALTVNNLAHAIDRAPMHRRLLASLVDGALIAATSLSLVALALSRSPELPRTGTAELGAGLALVLIAILYEAFFLMVGGVTPGMKYAHLRLRTFEGSAPTCGRRIQRFASLLLSVLPAGLGILWSIFDKDHMGWHDRLSHTYPETTYGGAA